MKTHSQPHHTAVRRAPALLCTGFAMLGIVTGPILAADAITSTITSKVDVTRPQQRFTAEESRSLSLAASRVLKHTGQALDALAEKRNDAAAANIEKGLTLLRLVDGILQPAVVKTEIQGAGVTYTDEDSVKPPYVTLFREYEDVDVAAYADAQKLKTGPLAGQAVRGPEFIYSELDSAALKFNQRLAKRDLLRAQEFLKKGDTEKAAAALEDIPASALIVDVTRTNSPLVRAMDNLRLAEVEVKNQHPDDAKAALDGAVAALQIYEKVTGDTRSADIAALQKEIGDVAKNIAAHEPATFSQKVSGWWGKCLSWFKR